MSNSLERLLRRDPDTAAMVAGLLVALPGPIALCAPDGSLLAGRAPTAGARRYQLHDGEELVGWAAGPPAARVLATVVERLVVADQAKRCLAREALERYRELNLLYDLAESLGASLEVGATAQAVLREARRVIAVGGGALLLSAESADELVVVAASAIDFRHGPPSLTSGIVGAVVQNRRAELVSSVATDPRSAAAEQAFAALICAPITTKRRVLGVLLIASTTAASYNAGDLRLLQAVAALAAPALDAALVHTQTLQEAAEQQRQLERQIEALRAVDRAQLALCAEPIVASEYFLALRAQSRNLRGLLDKAGEA